MRFSIMCRGLTGPQLTAAIVLSSAMTRAHGSGAGAELLDHSWRDFTLGRRNVCVELPVAPAGAGRTRTRASRRELIPISRNWRAGGAGRSQQNEHSNLNQALELAHGPKERNCDQSAILGIGSPSTPSTQLNIYWEPVDRRGRYRAELADGAALVVSRQPFLDGARALISAGYSPEAMLVGWRKGSACWALRARLGDAAKLTVDEAKTCFARWKPFPRLRWRQRLVLSEGRLLPRPTHRRPLQWAPRPREQQSEDQAGARALNALLRSVCRGRSGAWCSEVPPPSSSADRPSRTRSPPINDSKAPHLKAAAPPQRYTGQTGCGITKVQATLCPLRPATTRYAL